MNKESKNIFRIWFWLCVLLEYFVLLPASVVLLGQDANLMYYSIFIGLQSVYVGAYAFNFIIEYEKD